MTGHPASVEAFVFGARTAGSSGRANQRGRLIDEAFNVILRREH
jgi:hypothetical protein